MASSWLGLIGSVAVPNRGMLRRHNHGNGGFGLKTWITQLHWGVEPGAMMNSHGVLHPGCRCEDKDTGLMTLTCPVSRSCGMKGRAGPKLNADLRRACIGAHPMRITKLHWGVEPGP